MGLIRKTEMHGNPEVGTILFSTMRLPFRIFSKNPDTILFQPALNGAGWHKINLEKLNPELFSELIDKKDPISAMQFLRNNGMLDQ